MTTEATNLPAFAIEGPSTGPSLDDARNLSLAAAHQGLVDGTIADKITGLIATATRLAEAGRPKDAVTLFVETRRFIKASCGEKKLIAEVTASHVKLDSERDAFRRSIEALGQTNARQRVLVLSDSLALPRNQEGRDGINLAETYAALIQDRLAQRGPALVTPLCRRFGTSEHVLQDLQTNRAEIKGAVVLVHIGLNDCATRIFMEDERTALTMLPKATQEEVTQFVRRYRAQIVAADLDHCYVPLPAFHQAAEQIVKTVRSYGGKGVAFATIVQPPTTFGKRTPFMAWNFSRYNMALYEINRTFSAGLIDIDRLCWERDPSKTLVTDGMHISSEGHTLMADGFMEYWDTLKITA